MNANTNTHPHPHTLATQNPFAMCECVRIGINLWRWNTIFKRKMNGPLKWMQTRANRYDIRTVTIETIWSEIYKANRKDWNVSFAIVEFDTITHTFVSKSLILVYWFAKCLCCRFADICTFRSTDFIFTPIRGNRFEWRFSTYTSTNEYIRSTGTFFVQNGVAGDE